MNDICDTSPTVLRQMGSSIVSEIRKTSQRGCLVSEWGGKQLSNQCRRERKPEMLRVGTMPSSSVCTWRTTRTFDTKKNSTSPSNGSIRRSFRFAAGEFRTDNPFRRPSCHVSTFYIIAGARAGSWQTSGSVPGTACRRPRCCELDLSHHHTSNFYHQWYQSIS